MSFCTALTVSLSCLAIAWPRSDSTLKLFVLVGKIRNATIVTSLCSDCIQTIKQQIAHKCQTSNLFNLASSLLGISIRVLHNGLITNRIIHFTILTQHCYVGCVSSDHISRQIFLRLLLLLMSSAHAVTPHHFGHFNHPHSCLCEFHNQICLKYYLNIHFNHQPQPPRLLWDKQQAVLNTAM